MDHLLDAAVRALPWLALDLEMTGLDPASDRVCEVGLIAGGVAGESAAWSQLIDPGVSMNTDARQVHGLGPEDVAGAPAFADVLPGVLERMAGSVVIAHGATHDRAFLEAACTRHGFEMPEVIWLDTLAIARRMLLLPSHRLGHLSEALGVELGQAHRALDDARATFQVWQILLDMIDPGGDMSARALLGAIEGLDRRSEVRAAQTRVLREAFAAQRAVRIVYVSQGADGRVRTTEREVDIWKVTLPRVQGFCHLRGEARVFRLERMRHVELLDRAYEIPTFDARI